MRNYIQEWLEKRRQKRERAQAQRRNLEEGSDDFASHMLAHKLIDRSDSGVGFDDGDDYFL